MMAIRLIGLIFIAYLVFKDAKKQGFSSLAALFWAIILGASSVFFQLLFFMPLYFIFRRKAVFNAQYGSYQGDVIDVEATIVEDKIENKCYSCGKNIKTSDIICPYCSSKIKS